MLCPSNVYGDNGLTPREVAKRKTNLRNQQGQVNNHLHPVYELIDYVKINDQIPNPYSDRHNLQIKNTVPHGIA